MIPMKFTFSCKSIDLQRKLYSIHKTIRIDLGFNNLKFDADIDQLYEKTKKIKLRLDNLVTNYPEPYFQKDKYLFFSELNQKIKHYIELYDGLKKLMIKVGINNLKIDSFIKSKNDYDSYYISIRRQRIDPHDILKQAEVIFKFVTDHTN